MVLVPAHSLTRLESFRQLLFRFYSRQSNLEGAGQKYWTAIVRHGKSLLLAKAEFLSAGVVCHVPARGLSAKPLAHVPLRGSRLFRQSRGCLRSARRQSLVQPQFIADANQCRVKGRAKIDHCLNKQFV